MPSIRSLVENLNIFERNKIPLEKILGLALYIQLSSLRKTAKALPEIHKVSRQPFSNELAQNGEKVLLKNFNEELRK